MNNIVTLPDNCTVRMDGQLYESKDFVAVLGRENGDTSIFYFTDALTLGMALKLISREFVMCINECTEEDRKEIEEILGEAFMLERSKDE